MRRPGYGILNYYTAKFISKKRFNLSVFLYISGLLIGIAAFIYMLSMYEKAKVKILTIMQETS